MDNIHYSGMDHMSDQNVMDQFMDENEASFLDFSNDSIDLESTSDLMDWSNLLTSDNNVLNVQKNYNEINSSDGGLSFLQGSDGATEVQRQLYIQASSIETSTSNLIGAQKFQQGPIAINNNVVLGGQSIQVQTIQGQTVQGQTIQGHTVLGQTIQGQTFLGQTNQGQTVQGQTIQGHTVLGQTVQGQTLLGQTIQGQQQPMQTQYQYIQLNQSQENFPVQISFPPGTSNNPQSILQQPQEQNTNQRAVFANHGGRLYVINNGQPAQQPAIQQSNILQEARPISPMVVPQKFINTPSAQPVVVHQMARPSGQNALFQTTGQNNGGVVQVVQGHNQEFGSNAGSIVLSSSSPAASFQQRVIAQAGSQVGNLSTLPQLAPGSGANLVEDGSNGGLLVQIGNQVYRLEQKTLPAQQQTGIMVQQRNVASPMQQHTGIMVQQRNVASPMQQHTGIMVQQRNVASPLQQHTGIMVQQRNVASPMQQHTGIMVQQRNVASPMQQHTGIMVQQRNVASPLQQHTGIMVQQRNVASPLQQHTGIMVQQRNVASPMQQQQPTATIPQDTLITMLHQNAKIQKILLEHQIDKLQLLEKQQQGSSAIVVQQPDQPGQMQQLQTLQNNLQMSQLQQHQQLQGQFQQGQLQQSQQLQGQLQQSQQLQGQLQQSQQLQSQMQQSQQLQGQLQQSQQLQGQLQQSQQLQGQLQQSQQLQGQLQQSQQLQGQLQQSQQLQGQLQQSQQLQGQLQRSQQLQSQLKQSQQLRGQLQIGHAQQSLQPHGQQMQRPQSSSNNPADSKTPKPGMLLVGGQNVRLVSVPKGQQVAMQPQQQPRQPSVAIVDQNTGVPSQTLPQGVIIPSAATSQQRLIAVKPTVNIQPNRTSAQTDLSGIANQNVGPANPSGMTNPNATVRPGWTGSISGGMIQAKLPGQSGVTFETPTTTGSVIVTLNAEASGVPRYNIMPRNPDHLPGPSNPSAGSTMLSSTEVDSQQPQTSIISSGQTVVNRHDKQMLLTKIQSQAKQLKAIENRTPQQERYLRMLAIAHQKVQQAALAPQVQGAPTAEQTNAATPSQTHSAAVSSPSLQTTCATTLPSSVNSMSTRMTLEAQLKANPQLKEKFLARLAQMTPEERENLRSVYLKLQEKKLPLMTTTPNSNQITATATSTVAAKTLPTTSTTQISTTNAAEVQKNKYLPGTKLQRVKNNLAKDQHKAREPDYKTPFKTVKDALCALAPYHVYQTKDDPADRVAMAECAYEEMSRSFLERKDAMLVRYRYRLLNSAMREHETSELVMLSRMFLTQEREILESEKVEAEQNPDSFIPRPVIKSADDGIKKEPEDSEYDAKEESSDFYDVKLEVKEEIFDDTDHTESCDRSEQDDYKPLKISIAHEQFQNRPLKTETPLISPIKSIRVKLRRIDDENGEPSYKARRMSSMEPQESESSDIQHEFDFDRSICDNTATVSSEIFPSCGATNAMDTELSEDDAAVTSLLNMEHLESSGGFGRVSCSPPRDDTERHRFAEESDGIELGYQSNFQIEADLSGSHYSYDEQDAMSSSRFECEEAVEPASQYIYIEPENLDCSNVDPNNWNYGSSVTDYVQQDSDNELNSIMADLNRFNEDLSGTLNSWDNRMSENVTNADDVQLEGVNDVVSMGGYENSEASSLQNEMQSAINSILMLQHQPNPAMRPHSSREQNLFDDFDLGQSNDDLDAAVNSILF